MHKLKKICAIIFLLVIWVSTSVASQTKADFATVPKKNNKSKWKIAYYEGGEYLNYQLVFIATIEQLMALGWIETVTIPKQDGEQTTDLWKWLVKNVKSDYIEFVKDGHYTAKWDDNLTKKMVDEIINRFNTKKDIDLIIAAGTSAGKGLANDRHHTPTIVISTSDPIGAGIVKSVEDSGNDHILARVDPRRYERQIRIFHEVIGFKKLGVAYENSKSGRAYAAITDVEKISKENGFEIVRCYTEDEVPDVKVSEESVKKCFRELSKKVDAIYVTEQNGINRNNLPELVKIVNSAHIPTFSQASSDEVKAGFLMSISQAGWKYVGKFYAETIAKVFNGAKPGQLEQLFEDPTKIAINLKTAEIIQYDPPVDVLGSADEIYTEIVSPK